MFKRWVVYLLPYWGLLLVGGVLRNPLSGR